jgi:hypothetical protein
MSRSRSYRSKALISGTIMIVSLVMSMPSTTTSAAPLTAAAVPAVAAKARAVPAVAAVVPAEFGMAVWSPLRTRSRISCVRTNCPGPYHGKWAIDFLDTDRSTFDPLFAAAPGIVHIGEITGANACIPGTTSYGTWIWIDHGNGRTTRYTHLNSVLVKNLQRVTPRTKIGIMGHSGNNFPCRVEYLHMEFRVDNVRVKPPAMFSCVGARRVSLPSFLGYREWNVVPTNLRIITGTKRNVYTPAATNACMVG